MVRPLFSRLFKSRSAVSAVISNLILIAAVIAVGFAALGWTYSTSNSYVTQYGNSVRSSSAQLAESLAFEYAYYTGTALRVYILNCGTINTVNLTAAYVANATWTNSTVPLTIQLNWLDGTPIASNHLDMGQQGYFVWSGVVLQTKTSYTVKIITGRGSSFEYQLATR